MVHLRSNLCKSIIIRSVSTNSAKKSLAQTIQADDVRDSYYQKLGHQAVEHREKPDGWYDAKPFEAIPGPKSLPLLGNFWRFLPGGNLHNLSLLDLHRKLKKEYGNIVYLSGIPGQKPMIMLYDPDDIEKTLRNEGAWPIRNGMPSFVYYRNHVRNDIFQGVGGVLTVHGEEWFKFRSIVNKILMQPRTAEMYVDSMDDIANGLIENMRRLSRKDPKKEMPEDFQNELYKWTLESIGVIAYNKRLGCMDPNLSKDSEPQRFIDHVTEMFELAYKLDVLPSLWKIISTRNWRRYVKILDYLTEVNQKHIQEVFNNTNPDPRIPDNEKSVLERLAKTDKKVALAMATDMLIAGIDTTGRSMASALYYLAKNPDKQESLRKELRKCMPNKDSPVTKEMLRESQYLKAVIKETTRLAPIAIGNLRTSVVDMVLSGYQVPKGKELVGITILNSRDEKYFHRANEFIPERWLRTTQGELSHKNVHPFVYMPFGFGPRSCVGKRLANLELEVGIAKVIRNFNIAWNYPDAAFDIKLLYGIKDPVRIRVEEVTD